MKEDVKEEIEVKEKKDTPLFLYILNDDINEYAYVIHLLISICNLEPIQAEQCVYISHHKGECDVKKGSYSELKILKNRLIEKGLGVIIR